MAVLTSPALIAQQTAERLKPHRRADVAGGLFRWLLIGSTLFAVGFLVLLLVVMLVGGWDVIVGRPYDFVTSGFSQTSPEAAGVWHGIVGSLQMAFITATVAVPIGVATAVFLVEYAQGSRFARLVELNIRNLAGVPAIVYGMLGLAVFVNGLSSITNGKSVVAAGLTMSALVLPIVVITAVEGLKAVPSGIREAAYAVGATKWEALSRQVLPAAVATIFTGTVLALARAMGEAAPLVIVGAATGFMQFGDANTAETFFGPFTALPVLIFNFARQPGDEWRANAAAASVLILMLVLLVNGVAIYLRNRLEKKL